MTPSRIKYLGDIVVVVLAAKRERKSGIILPEVSQSDRIVEATVVATGSKCKLPVKPGDTVMVDSYLGTRRKMDNKDVVVYDSEDILLVVMQ